MRPLSTNTATNAALTITRPVYLVQIDAATPIYLSSREAITLRGNAHVAAGLQIDQQGARIALFNGDQAYTATFLAGLSGVRVVVRMLYGSGPFDETDDDVVLEGELGSIAIGEWITMQVRDAPAQKVPRLYVAPPVFNYLPPDGTLVQTTTGPHVLRGSR